MLAVVSLLAVVTISIVITRIATLALAATGISRQMARFQARSAFTGAGFTTRESEGLVTHPVRRRIIAGLMLLGNAGIATAVATLLLSFSDTDGTGTTLTRVLLLAGGLLLLLALANSSWIDRWMSRLIARALDRYTSLDVTDYAALLHVAGDYQVSELQVRAGDWLAQRPLARLDLPAEGVLVLGVTRPDASYIGAPRGDLTLREGDSVLFYGRAQQLQELDRRRRDIGGELAHVDAVAEQQLARDGETAGGEEEPAADGEPADRGEGDHPDADEP